MKRIFYIIILFSLSTQTLGQTNLVPNPSFEDYFNCPNNISQLYKAKKWKNFCGSPDYVNTCGQAPASVPYNFGGFQYAASGNAYCDVCVWENTILNAREFVAVKLDSNLVIGKKYFFSFKTNPCFKSSGGPAFSNKIGLKFTTFIQNDTNNVSNNSLINNQANVFSTNIITDTLNWTKISGSFIADSMYNYVVIGNFFNDANTSLDTSFKGGSWPYLGSYYAIDDVCVTRDSLFNSGFSVNTSENENNEVLLNIFPNPTSDRIFITLTNESKDITLSIYNKFGQIVLRKTPFTNSEIDMTSFADGLYFIEIHSDSIRNYQKVLVRH